MPLRGVEERWARALLGASDNNEDIQAVAKSVAKSTVISPDVRLEAETHLANASNWQQEIGSYATSGAEGVMSMSELRELQLARAWLSVGWGPRPSGRAGHSPTLWPRIQTSRQAPCSRFVG